jgi:DNA-binding NarL/FixJ family response regulator
MRILLADGQAKVRFALRVLLERQPGFKVVGEAATAEALQAFTANLCPDLILLDWELAGPSATDLLRALRSACPKLTVIGLSGQPEVHREALDAGADDFVSKGKPPENLLAAIARCCPVNESAAFDQALAAEDARKA